MYNILLVEDEPTVQRALARVFKTEGLRDLANLTIVGDLESADEIFLSKNNIDVVLLDISLPDGNGINYFRDIKANPDEYFNFNAETIFLTGDNDPMHVVKAFKDGASDYIKKPTSSEEFEAMKVRLIARIRSLEKKEEIILKNLVINLSNQSAFVYSQDKSSQNMLNLTPKEFNILWYLASRLGQTVSRDDLLEDVWGVKVQKRTIDTHVSKLNTKLNDANSAFLVESEYGFGYKLKLNPNNSRNNEVNNAA